MRNDSLFRKLSLQMTQKLHMGSAAGQSLYLPRDQDLLFFYLDALQPVTSEPFIPLVLSNPNWSPSRIEEMISPMLLEEEEEE